jgi:two-component system, OmpR family, sensor kinase
MSLATRLSLFFLATLAVVLYGFSGATYMLARSHFQRDLDERLMVALDGLAAVVGVVPGHLAWAPLGDPHPGEDPPSWAVFDGHGALVDGSRDGSLAVLREGSRRTPGLGHVHLSVTAPDGTRWRLAARRLGAGHKAEGSPSAPGPVVVTGTPLAPVEAGLSTLALTLAGVSAGLWIAATVVGYALCRRALGPVTRMARAATAMTATDRGQRLPSPGTGDELEDLARSFNGLLGRLHEALERQGRFTGDASHQLRTPLTALISEVELARRRDRTADDYRHVLDRIHGDAVRLRQIVEALLFLARADAEAKSPQLDRLDVRAWLTEHLESWPNHARAADLQIEMGGAGPLWVQAQAPLLGQLVDNLLENACKYSPAGTPITVRLAEEEGVSLSVADEGCGITAEDLPHVFEPFYRSVQARRQGVPGIGLGLAVAQRIALALGGVLRVESQEGKGAQFLLQLSAPE